MGVDQVVQLGRSTLIEILLLAMPILSVAVLVSLVVNLGQVLTSLQEQTISAVPRLLAAATATFFLMPWMWRHLSLFTIKLFSDFHAFLQ